jgi:hypothetical protein
MRRDSPRVKSPVLQRRRHERDITGMAVYELAQRQGNGTIVRLLWDSARNQVVLRYRDRETGDAFVIDVPNPKALTAFHHPNVFRPDALAA